MILVKTDITVEQNGATLTVDVDYTVSDVGTITGGNVTLTVGASNADTITVFRSQNFDREVDYQESGDFLSETVNDDFNRMILMLQQNREELSRTIEYAIDDTISNRTIPALAGRIGKLLGFDSAGDLNVQTLTDTNISTDATIAAAVDNHLNQTRYELGSTAALASHAGIAAGHIIKTNYLDSNRTADSGSDVSFNGTTTPGKAGNWADTTNGIFHDADGKECELIGDVFIKKFGAIPGAVTDATTAIKTAIASLGGNPGSVFTQDGNFLVTSTVTISNDRQHLIGNGAYSTRITFTPIADDTCFLISAGASVIVQGSIRDMTIFSGDSTFEKIAIDVSDQSGYEVSNIVIGGSVLVGASNLWSGGAGGSQGLSCKGREQMTVDRFSCAADRPITINDNPNSTIDIDHYSFKDLTLLGGPTYPLVTVADGVNLSNVDFLGFQAWVIGSDGFFWNDTTTVGISQQLSISNVRWEQSVNAAGYMIHIVHNSDLQNLTITNCMGGLANLGIKLRKCLMVSIHNTWLLNTSGVQLDVDDTVDQLVLDNFTVTTGATISTGSLRKIYGTGAHGPGGAVVPISATYVTSTQTLAPYTFDVPVGSVETTMAVDDTLTIGAAGNTRGHLLISTNEDVGAHYYLKGLTAATQEISDIDGFFSVTKDQASQVNIYHDGGDYIIQNKRPIQIKVRYLVFGGF